MSITIRIKLNPHLFLRDPQDTKLGRKIIQNSILLIEELGFECFTFKKLAARIGSTEASVYRYFENKHLLLTYLVSWYWEWVRFQIELRTMNISDSKQKLETTISILVESSHENPMIEFVNEQVLHKIVIAEGTKAYHTIDVDEENKKGIFKAYKDLVQKIADLILEINEDFPYPHALASNLVEMANNQIYFAQHLPNLTDVHLEEQNWQEVIEMMKFFAFKLVERRA